MKLRAPACAPSGRQTQASGFIIDLTPRRATLGAEPLHPVALLLHRQVPEHFSRNCW